MARLGAVPLCTAAWEPLPVQLLVGAERQWGWQRAIEWLPCVPVASGAAAAPPPGGPLLLCEVESRGGGDGGEATAVVTPAVVNLGDDADALLEEWIAAADAAMAASGVGKIRPVDVDLTGMECD